MKAKIYSSGFAGEAISRERAATFAGEIANTAIEVTELAERIRALCDDYKVWTSRVEPAPAAQRAALRKARAKAGELVRLLDALDEACRERVARAYARCLVVAKGTKRLTRSIDTEAVRRLETMLDEAAGYGKLPTRQDETLDLRRLVRGLALEWQRYTGQKFTMGKQAFGSPAGEWIKAIVTAIAPEIPKKTVNNALAAALKDIRKDGVGQ